MSPLTSRRRTTGVRGKKKRRATRCRYCVCACLYDVPMWMNECTYYVVCSREEVPMYVWIGQVWANVVYVGEEERLGDSEI